ncbi:MAG TPA: helix-turn-helix domain-containing protein [Solirubrobacterales bacterium]|jgi:DNA-binding PucR family transcriptional regulator|nr:helix-turn-helix domain-containing protein [Solirubrobacterales bacterium]
MSAREKERATRPDETFEELSAAIESGAGLPAVARAAAKALDASVALIDRSSAVLAVAAASPDEESKLLAGGDPVRVLDLRVADSAVGELRWRPRGEDEPGPALLRMMATLLGLELERSRSPEWASEEAARDFVRSLLDRTVTDRGDIAARAGELGSDLSSGAGVLMARAIPRAAQSGEWRGRVLMIALRAVRAISPAALAAEGEHAGERAEIVAIVPTNDDARLGRAAESLATELEQGLTGFAVTVSRSRVAADPVDLYRAGQEARLAANVGEAEGAGLLAFEDTGAYRLLLPAMSEDPAELERFYSETVEPLVAYDEQYETHLMKTVETYLDHDGNVAATAQTLFTHRHTIRYRLERAKELCGHDATSTAGREKLGLGLKAMRVLGIAPPVGPAGEPGSEAGKVARQAEAERE